MKQILIYADSLSWGIIPDTRKRLAFDERWPGVLENRLIAAGISARVVEDCLNGRRTVWEDPYKPGRNGLQGLEQRIEAHSPLSLVILMLGTNDFQSMHQHSPWHSAQGIATLINAIRRAPIEPGMPAPPILVIAPPVIGTPKGTIATKFQGGQQKCIGLPIAFQQVAEEYGTHFFDAGKVTETSRIDGIHLDADQHLLLGKAIAQEVQTLLDSQVA